MTAKLLRMAAACAAVFAVSMVLPQTAAAQAPVATGEDGGVYVAVGGGWQQRLRAGETATTYTDFKNGHAFNVAAGYEFQRLAVEGEVSFFGNDAEVVASDATGPQEGVGGVTMQFFMANTRYSFGEAAVRPYVGAGIGGYKSDLNDLSNVVAEMFGFVATGSNDGLTFAYQLRAGVQMHLVGRSDLLLGYRYVRGSELLFLNTAFGDLRPDGVRMHNIEATLKIGF